VGLAVPFGVWPTLPDLRLLPMGPEGLTEMVLPTVASDHRLHGGRIVLLQIGNTTTFIQFLLIVQYIYSMDLKDTELLVTSYLEIIGFIKASSRVSAFTTLCVKVSSRMIGFNLHGLPGTRAIVTFQSCVSESSSLPSCSPT
jgi:hypothetical protein